MSVAESSPSLSGSASLPYAASFPTPIPWGTLTLGSGSPTHLLKADLGAHLSLFLQLEIRMF